MSISVQYGSDTYTFSSHEGRHYWFLSNTPRSSFCKMIGMIAPFSLSSQLYEMAIAGGYTVQDFDRVRTFAPIKQSRASTKTVKRVSSRMASERKAPVRKSTLNNSIKLF
jgi:hypothetical protein